MNRGKTRIFNSIVACILVASFCFGIISRLTTSVIAAEDKYLTGNQKLATISPEQNSNYLSLKKQLKKEDTKKQEYKLTDEERKSAIGYLAYVSIQKGEDPAQLNAEEIEDIKYLANVLESAIITQEEANIIEKEWGKNRNTEEELSDGDRETITIGLVGYDVNEMVSGVNDYAKGIEIKALRAEQETYTNMYYQVHNDILKKELANKAGELKEARKAIDNARVRYDKAINNRATTDLTRDKFLHRMDKDIVNAKGELVGAEKNLKKIQEGIIEEANKKSDDVADMLAKDKKMQVSKHGKPTKFAKGAQVIGVIANGATWALDVYALATDDMVAKKNGEDEAILWAERSAVALDGTIAGLGVASGIAALTGAEAVAFGTSIVVSWPIALVALSFTLLAHTETGHKIVKDTTSWITDKTLGAYDWLVGNKFGVDNMGDKMIEHINDSAYMEQLLIKLANKNAGRTKPANGVGALKPNIYLYPEEQTDVIVSFDHPELLTTVIPDYSGNWSVTAEPDGTLHSEDGQDYSYLFYESETQPFFFGNSEGWLIETDERAERYTEILKEYGFNDKEIADFVEFWVEKLPEGVDYMMYPNVTEVIDKAMPVSFSTEPDSIFRIWFTFEPYDGQIVPEPEIDEIARDGFTVVEWGGVILN